MSTLGTFSSPQSITADELVCNDGALHTAFHHMSHVHQTSSGSVKTVHGVISHRANSLKYWTPLSVVVQLAGWHTVSSLKRYLSFMPNRNGLQRL